jgi:hypothetical protein
MNPTYATSTRYGSLLLKPGERYRVIAAFKDYDGIQHPAGEEWVFRGYDIFPYDDGHSLFVTFESGEKGVIRLQWHPQAQAHILESLQSYVTAMPRPE